MTEWDSTPEGKTYHKKVLKEWREKNREKSNAYHKEYMKAWRERNRAKINAKSRQWRAENHERVKEYRKEYMRKWREEHREEQKEYRHNYYMATRDVPEDSTRVIYHEEKYDPHSITQEEWLKKYGYPMGDTTGWENWQGWDNRIRRYDEV